MYAPPDDPQICAEYQQPQNGASSTPPAPKPAPPTKPTPPKPSFELPFITQGQQSTCSLPAYAQQDAKELMAIDDAIAPIESRVVPAAGMITAGLGVAYGSILAMGAFPLSIPVAVPVGLAGVGLAAEGAYYGATGRFYTPSSCR